MIEARHFDGEKLILEKVNSKGDDTTECFTLPGLPPQFSSDWPRPTLPVRCSAIRRGIRGMQDSVRCRFRRLKQELGVPDLWATTLRHSWATGAHETGRIRRRPAS